jgi:hypothetical protein
MASHGARQMVQGSDILVHDGPVGVGSPAGALPSAVAEHLSWVGCQEGIPSPSLSAFERLEEKAVGAPVQLGESSHRRVAVEHYFPGYRRHAPGLGAGGKDLEAIAHWGAATR